MSTTNIAEIRAKVTGGTDITNTLGAMRQGTLSAKEATLLLRDALVQAGKAQDAWGKIGKQVIKDSITDIKLQTDATKQAARDSKAAAKEEADVKKEAARAIAQAKREEIRAQREAAKHLREANKEARAYAQTMKEIASNAVKAFGDVSKLAGVRGFGELKKDVDSTETLMIKAQASMGMSKSEWDKSGAQNTLFSVAKQTGQPLNDVIQGFIKAQNETSGGQALLADGGALLKSQANFAKITGASTGDTAITMAKFAEQFGMSPEEQAKIPADLYQQQLEGSLEADTASKFVKTSSLYQMITGKNKREGFLNMMALANTVKDQAGFQGKEGAANAATHLGSLLGDMTKGKSVTGADTSPSKMFSKFLGHDVKDKDGHVDMTKLTDDLLTYREKVGDKKFSEVMSMSLRNKQARMTMMWLMAGRQKYKAGDEKSIESMSNPDTKRGSSILDALTEQFMGTANSKNEVLATEEVEKGLKNQNQTKQPLIDFRKWWGGIKAENPVMDVVMDNPGVQGAAVLTASAALSKWGGPLLKGGSKLLGGTAGAGLGLASILGMSGDGSGIGEDAAYQLKLAESLSNKLNKRRQQGGKRGGESGWEDTASMEQRLKSAIQFLIEKNKPLPPQVNIYIQATGVEARTVPEAKPTSTLAKSSNNVPVATPGRK